jgi:hypothetical protein
MNVKMENKLSKRVDLKTERNDNHAHLYYKQQE